MTNTVTSFRDMYRPEHIQTVIGRTFSNTSQEEVLDFLQSRSVQKIGIKPHSFRVALVGNVLVGRIGENGSTKEFPLRRSALDKLLAWFHFPKSTFYRFDADTLVATLNNVIKLMRSETIRVVVEDGSITTITSDKFTEISDIEILQAIHSHPKNIVSRDDYMMRIWSLTDVQTEPIPGDISSVGFNTMNSETGFRSLTVTALLYRYWCSNGATVAFAKKRTKFSHYNLKADSPALFMRQLMGDCEQHSGELLNAYIAAPTESAVLYREFILNRLDGTLGKFHRDGFLRNFDFEKSTKYDLINFITDNAKIWNLSLRSTLEEISGEVLLHSPQV